ncbi:MAG: WYL domain-containing protein [Planctomycetaceae bacterium]|nr:WYL domain-containing protein [Planctomycetaceae bacterium]
MASGDRLKRLLRLVELLQSGRTYHAQDLADICDVSLRTFFRDLTVLQQAGVEVVNAPERGGYSIARNTALPSTNLTIDETMSLLVLSHGFSDGADAVPFVRPARTAAAKLLSSLPDRVRNYASELTQTLDVRLDAPAHLANSSAWFNLLTSAVSRRRQVRIRYRSLNEGLPSDLTTLLSPYRLLFARRTWYVIGRSSVHRSVRTFHLGRIGHAEIIEEEYEIPARFSLERFLGNAWFLINERGQSFDVHVRFQSKVAENVAEVRWHRTQQITRNADGTLDFRVTVSSLKEIAWWILGYGDQAEALSPPELREELRRRIASMQRHYERP